MVASTESKVKGIIRKKFRGKTFTAHEIYGALQDEKWPYVDTPKALSRIMMARGWVTRVGTDQKQRCVFKERTR